MEVVVQIGQATGQHPGLPGQSVQRSWVDLLAGLARQREDGTLYHAPLRGGAKNCAQAEPDEHAGVAGVEPYDRTTAQHPGRPKQYVPRRRVDLLAGLARVRQGAAAARGGSHAPLYSSARVRALARVGERGPVAGVAQVGEAAQQHPVRSRRDVRQGWVGLDGGLAGIRPPGARGGGWDRGVHSAGRRARSSECEGQDQGEGVPCSEGED